MSANLQADVDTEQLTMFREFLGPRLQDGGDLNDILKLVNPVFMNQTVFSRLLSMVDIVMLSWHRRLCCLSNEVLGEVALPAYTIFHL